MGLGTTPPIRKSYFWKACMPFDRQAVKLKLLNAKSVFRTKLTVRVWLCNLQIPQFPLCNNRNLETGQQEAKEIRNVEGKSLTKKTTVYDCSISCT